MKRVCDALLAGDKETAARIVREDYPLLPQQRVQRTYDPVKATLVFVRDGFIDRYAGSQLVHPGALVLVTRLLPGEFPMHPNWKFGETHMAYWELFPIIDHVVPVTRGGGDDESNWVTTSALRNSAKAHWTLEELGWTLFPPGDFNLWDGLMEWMLEYVKKDPACLEDRNIKRWHGAAVRALAIHRSQPTK